MYSKHVPTGEELTACGRWWDTASDEARREVLARARMPQTLQQSGWGGFRTDAKVPILRAAVELCHYDPTKVMAVQISNVIMIAETPAEAFAVS